VQPNKVSFELKAVQYFISTVREPYSGYNNWNTLLLLLSITKL
jgi:hypothetical protein